MDLESSCFSTADYSFHQAPPDNNNFEVENIAPNINEPSTANNSDNKSWNSLRTLGTPYFPLHFTDESVLIEIEFDAGVTPPSTTLPVYYNCGQSLSLDSIRSFDLEDTVLNPVPVNQVEKVALKQCQIIENYYSPFPKFPFHENQQHFPFYRTIKFNHLYKFYSFCNSVVQEKYCEVGRSFRFLESHHRVDCPSSAYQKTLWESAHFSTPKKFEYISNCYSVTPVRTSTLFVNQVIKRICFSDITTYHPTPYEYTRNNKDPSKRLVIRPKSVFVARRQSKIYHYLVEYKNRVPHKSSRWFSNRPRKYRVQKNLQDTLLQFCDGTDATKDLFPEQPITWYFKSDTETNSFF
jgi:hypothetical protein